MNNELFFIRPGELKFPFKLKMQSSCSLELVNNTDNYVAFKVKTTSVKMYAVQPSRGVVPPKVTCKVTVTMQAPKEAPPGMECKDRFLVQSVVAPSGTTVKDIGSDMFNKEPCGLIEEKKLRVIYVAPPQIPSIPESQEEGQAQNEDTGNMNSDVLSSILVSVNKCPDCRPSQEEGQAQNEDTGNMNSDVLSSILVLKDLNELKDKLLEAEAKISKLTEEKSATFQKNQKLVEELALIKSNNHGRTTLGFPFLFVFFIGIAGIISGYYFHS